MPLSHDVLSHNRPQRDPRIGAYLEQRDHQPTFVLVEIGHGANPVAYQQPVPFTGQRAYIGIEAWLRDAEGKKRDHIAKLSTENPHLNVFYISHNPGDQAEREDIAGQPRSYYDGPYDPTTHLPEEAPDEVLLSNVFGDPHVAESVEAPKRLLAEVKRLVTWSGKIIVRETLSPRLCRLSPAVVAGAGLTALRVDQSHSADWAALEARYNGTADTELLEMPTIPSDDNFYLLLSKSRLT